jgi:hypothetical protein
MEGQGGYSGVFPHIRCGGCYSVRAVDVLTGASWDPNLRVAMFGLGFPVASNQAASCVPSGAFTHSL